jgi:poly-gamma-glutamate capsule biosynthesis protein CapA/YwtB (metallophosphatase superfamily)
MNDDFRDRLRSPRGDSPRYNQPRPQRPPRPAQRPAQQNVAQSQQPAQQASESGYNQYPDSMDDSYSRQPSSQKPRKKSKKKLVLITLLLMLLIGGGGAYYWFFLQEEEDSGQLSLTNLRKDQPEQAEEATPIRLIATGDMIAHDTVNQDAKKPDGTYDYASLMSGMKPFFDKSDIKFCNQSTMAGGEEFGLSGYPVFNAPVAFSRGMEELGCNVINIGTNHTNDKGQELINATIAGWEDREKVLAVAGANRNAEEQQQIRYFEVKGMKFAFLAYSTYTNVPMTNEYGLNMYSDELATAQITEAQDEADFIIVSMRWGTEYSPEINAEQDAVSQKLADLGAHVVFGHGPHVLGPVKTLEGQQGNKTLVWYSLGNFLNTQLETEALVSGIAVMDIDPETKQITTTQMMPIYMHYEWTAQEQQAQNLQARKNLAMFPLDKSAEALASARLGTTVEEQTARVEAIITRHMDVEIITSAEF